MVMKRRMKGREKVMEIGTTGRNEASIRGQGSFFQPLVPPGFKTARRRKR